MALRAVIRRGVLLGAGLIAAVLLALAGLAPRARADTGASTITTTTTTTGTSTGSSLTACPWLNTALSVAARTNLLLSHMTLADKIDELYVNPPTTSGPYVGYEGWVPAQPALCIPALVEQDGPSGVGYLATDVTQLPAEVSLGSAWDPQLAEQYGAVNGLQHREKGIAMVLGPGVNIDRDPRWGRNFENFSEDPFLTAALGAADIEGIQSQGVMADVKHFATYNQETYRNTSQDNNIVGARALHEIYLPPFYSAVKQANVASVMCAYSLLNGQYSCQNESILNEILDTDWGYAGFVRSDGDANQSTVTSANAGLDQSRGSYYWDNGLLAAAVENGQVAMSTINQALRRVLMQMFRFNLFNDPPAGNLSSPADSASADKLALNVAERGTVLLKNASSILPLSTAKTKSIAVIGADGSSSALTAGGGSSYVIPTDVISPVTGITDRVGSAGTVTSYSGTSLSAAAATAKAAQVAVVFVSAEETEGSDLTSLSLPNNQDALIEAVAAANPNTVVVLNTGGPVLMPWLGSVKAVVEAWYPGQEDGAAAAAVLFGDVDPSGHLTETFPTSLSAIPTASKSQFPGTRSRVLYSEGLDVGYRWYDAHNVKPLFPFGYGLSYTSFKFSNLKVTHRAIVNAVSGPDATAGQNATVDEVSAQITNTGSVAGGDVVQLYLGDPRSAGEPPRQLEGFRRVTLAPGRSQVVTFALTGHELSYFNTEANGWTLPTGAFSIYVGDSSALTSLPLRGKLTVTKTIGVRYAALVAPATVTAGTTFEVNARFVNRGNLRIVNGTATLGFPSGWKVVRLARTRRLSLAPGQSATRKYRVTAPQKSEGGVYTLTAHLTSAGADGGGNLSGSTAITVRRPVALAPSTSIVVNAGTTGTATIAVTNDMSSAVTVHLAPTVPAGVTITPAAPSIRVPAGGSARIKLAVTVAAGQVPATESVALNPSFSCGSSGNYSLSAAELTVDIPYASLSAAFDSVAISDDANVTSANFDGDGNSFSEQALKAIGLSPGATFTSSGTSLQWPDVPAGSADNVQADGQTISLSGSPLDTELVVVGASTGTDESGIGMVTYTDGTMQTYTLTLDDWFNSPDSASNIIAASPTYINDSNASTNTGVAGRRVHGAHVFSVLIPLLAGKTVSSVTLPMVATDPGVFPMHIFAVGLGSATLQSTP